MKAFFLWLAKIIEDGKSGNPSAKRASLIIATLCLGAGTIILCIAAYRGHDVALALAAVTGPLAGLSGYGYVQGKKVENLNKQEST